MAELPVAGEADEAMGDGVLLVVRVTVVGLTGITVDSSMEVKVGIDKELPAPPQQMKAVLAVMRDSETHCISALSKRIVKTEAVEEHNGKISRHQRYIAVWNNSKSNQDESVSFETKLPVGNDAPRSLSHRNFELIVGLTPGNSTKVTPIGAASLPVAEAARLRGSNGKVVLDLPVYNFASLAVDPFAKPSKEAGIPLTTTSNFRRKLAIRKPEKVVNQPFTQRQKKKALGYDYYMDPGRDAAILRVELEMHEKESNVEVGLVAAERTKPPRVVFLNSQHQAVETTHSVMCSSKSNYVVDNIVLCMEPSIESVLSAVAGESQKMVPTAPQPPIPERRFRVKVVDQTILDSALAAVAPKVVSVDDELFATKEDEKVMILDAAIERVLSMKQKYYEEGTTIQGVQNSAYSTPPPRLKTRCVRLTPPLVPKAARLPAQPSKKSKGFDSKPSSSPKISPDKPEQIRRNGLFGLLQKRGKSKKEAVLPALPPKKSVLPPKTSSNSAKEIKARDTTLAASAVNEVALNPALQSSQLALTDADSSNSLTSTSDAKAVTKRQPEAPRDTLSKPIAKKWGQLKQPLMQLQQKSSGSSMTVGQRFGVKVPPGHAVAKPGTTTANISSQSRKISNSDSFCGQVSDPALNNPVSAVAKAKELQVEDISESVPLLSSGAVSVASTSAGSTPGKDELDEWKVDAVVDYSPERPRTPEKDPLRSTSPSPAYSTSLPNFSQEETTALFREKYDDNSIVEIGTFQAEHVVLPVQAKDQPSTAKDLKQKMFGIMNLQPCTGKLDGLLADEEEDYTVADSWTENGTMYTNKSRKESLQDDLADLGLLLGDFCRPIGVQVRDDLSVDGTAFNREQAKETIASTLWGKNGTKRRWMAELGAAVLRPFGDDLDTSNSKHSISDGLSWAEATQEDDYDETASASGSSRTSGGSVFTEERTLESETQEETEEREQGTEVDVKDVNLALAKGAAISMRASEARKGADKFRFKTVSSKISEGQSATKQPRRPNLSASVGGQSKEKTLGSLKGTQSMWQSKGLPKPGSEKDKTSTPSSNTRLNDVTTTTFGAVNSIPMVVLKRKVSFASTSEKSPTPEITCKAPEPDPPPKQIAPVEMSRGSNSATDNESPSNVMHPPMPVVQDANLKSLAQSLVDLVDYVISPTPAVRVNPTAPPPIPHVPSVLEADETCSVGDLTATTYEMQVDIDEFKRQIVQSERLARPSGGRMYDGTDTLNDDYFSDYDHSSLVSPEMNAAVDTAVAKQLAEGWTGNNPPS